MPGSDSTFLARLDRFGRYCENSLLFVLLGAMIAIGTMQIVQRNFLDSSFPWSDELLRLLVLWLGLVGAVAASRDDKHITIDILSRFLSEKNNFRLRLLLDFFTAFICGLLAWHGGRFVQMEREFASVVLNGLPAWIFEAIIPVAFGLIAYRYGLFFVRNIVHLINMRGES
jgi:TRAP-type C4-dicarboxylate transport system permease small subunit